MPCTGQYTGMPFYFFGSVHWSDKFSMCDASYIIYVVWIGYTIAEAKEHCNLWLCVSGVSFTCSYCIACALRTYWHIITVCKELIAWPNTQVLPANTQFSGGKTHRCWLEIVMLMIHCQWNKARSIVSRSALNVIDIGKRKNNKRKTTTNRYNSPQNGAHPPPPLFFSLSRFLALSLRFVLVRLKHGQIQEKWKDYSLSLWAGIWLHDNPIDTFYTHHVYNFDSRALARLAYILMIVWPIVNGLLQVALWKQSTVYQML